MVFLVLRHFPVLLKFVGWFALTTRHIGEYVLRLTPLPILALDKLGFGDALFHPRFLPWCHGGSWYILISTTPTKTNMYLVDLRYTLQTTLKYDYKHPFICTLCHPATVKALILLVF